MPCHRALLLLLSSALLAGLSIAQTADKSSSQRQTIRVGLAVMTNRSGRQASVVWERDQLLRELQRMRTNRKSSITIEAVALAESSEEGAEQEAAKKDCQYFVLTTMVDPGHGPGISGGPDGVAPAPVMIGNARPSQTLAVNFTIRTVNDPRTFAEGTATASVEDHNDTRAADEAMRMVAHQVATKLRENRPPKID